MLQGTWCVQLSLGWSQGVWGRQPPMCLGVGRMSWLRLHGGSVSRHGQLIAARLSCGGWDAFWVEERRGEPIRWILACSCSSHSLLAFTWFRKSKWLHRKAPALLPSFSMSCAALAPSLCVLWNMASISPRGISSNMWNVLYMSTPHPPIHWSVSNY